KLIYSTYLGGTLGDQANGVAVDLAGNAYVAGTTNSSNYPVTAGAYQSSNRPSFLTKLNATGDALLYSTYFGGDATSVNAVAVDNSYSAYVTGYTHSTNFPVSGGPYTSYQGGSADAVVVKMNAAGTAETYGTYLGGSGEDKGYAIAVGRDGKAYVTGSTASSN